MVSRLQRLVAHVRMALFAGFAGACCPQPGVQPYASRTVPNGEDGGGGGGGVPLAGVPGVQHAADLARGRCLGALQRAGVPHEMLEGQVTRAVDAPIRLKGPLNGVEFRAANGSETHEVVDCRLALALHAWSRSLREMGVTKVEHFSAFRPGARIAGSGRPSGHSRALALDAARFHLRDGRVIDVERDWSDRQRDAPVCPPRRLEREASELLRTAVCQAIELGTFQVVLTPHHDRAHHNHVHLELIPDVDWTYIH